MEALVFAAIISAIVGAGASAIQARQQKKSIRAERNAALQAERNSQEAQRNQIRQGAAAQGTGDFQTSSNSAGSVFGTQLAQLTGK